MHLKEWDELVYAPCTGFGVIATVNSSTSTDAIIVVRAQIMPPPLDAVLVTHVALVASHPVCVGRGRRRRHYWGNQVQLHRHSHGLCVVPTSPPRPGGPRGGRVVSHDGTHDLYHVTYRRTAEKEQAWGARGIDVSVTWVVVPLFFFVAGHRAGQHAADSVRSSRHETARLATTVAAVSSVSGTPAGWRNMGDDEGYNINPAFFGQEVCARSESEE
jgi:hypothetical protein